MGKTYKVIAQWFKKSDKFGQPYSSWCKKVNDYEVLCTICNRKISCSRKGFAALKQHVTTSLHKECVSVKLSTAQLLLKPRDLDAVPEENVPIPLPSGSCTENPSTSAASTLQLFNSREAVVKAELIWALKSVQCNMAASTTDDLNLIFSAMFPNFPVNFKLGRTKLTYLITEALGPYFREELLNDVRKSFFTLQYDETTNSSDKKELQFMVRYWSEAENQIVCRHLQTVFMGHSTAEDIVAEIKKVLAVSDLPLTKLIMLASDGPNVNKKVWNIINKFLIEERGHGLLDIGTCNLHIINNAFLKGLAEFGELALELVSDIFYFFKKFPSRWEDYEKCQMKKDVPRVKFLKHVSNRWLTAGPACKRLLDQWPAVEDYFLVFVPANSKQIMQTMKYNQIVKCLRIIDIKVELLFVVESAQLFTTFTTLFQRTEPLIHVLHSYISDVLKKITGRICKLNTDAESIIMVENLAEISEIDCTEKLTSAIKCLKEGDGITVLRKIQRHYMIAHNYLVKKNPLKHNLLQACKCLQPDKIKSPESIKQVGELAKALSMFNVNPIDAKDEWRLLQTEIPIYDSCRVDHFWKNIFVSKTSFGDIKYPSITKIVKISLCLAHGNGDVERGFSVSKRVMTDEKAKMSERVLNQRIIIKDSIKKYKHVSDIPITKELLRLAYGAYKSYNNYLEEERRRKEQSIKEKREKKKKEELKRKEAAEIESKAASINKLEDKVKVIAQEKKEVQETADALFQEANDRLKLGIEKSDLHQIRVAQGMLQGAEKLREEERSHEEKEKKLNFVVHKRKSSLIDSFLTKKPKNS